MTQAECLETPTHYTHYGVCYVGNPTFQLHGISIGDNPHWVTHPAPEPGSLPLLLLGAAFLVARYRRR